MHVLLALTIVLIFFSFIYGCLRISSLAELCIRHYETNGGSEFFLSFETPDRKTIFGFLRLRLRGQRGPRDCPFSVLRGAALLRELHVYGELFVHRLPF